MESRTDRYETALPALDRASRHVMLSSTRGVITELEVVGAPSEGMYMIRYRKASDGVGKILETGSWIGFCYHDAHWSFVKQ